MRGIAWCFLIYCFVLGSFYVLVEVVVWYNAAKPLYIFFIFGASSALVDILLVKCACGLLSLVVPSCLSIYSVYYTYSCQRVIIIFFIIRIRILLPLYDPSEPSRTLHLRLYRRRIDHSNVRFLLLRYRVPGLFIVAEVVVRWLRPLCHDNLRILVGGRGGYLLQVLQRGMQRGDEDFFGVQ